MRVKNVPLKSVQWWRGTATHMWRTYFELKKNPFTWENLTLPKQRIYAVCHHIFTTRFVKTDQDILQYYFTSKWGDDLYAVEDYSAKTGVPVKVIWMVIRRANRAVIEEVGLIERREGKDE
jgi:hypothetical protein